MKRSTLTMKIDSDLLVTPEITIDSDDRCEVVLKITSPFSPHTRKVIEWLDIHVDYFPLGEEINDQLVKFIKDTFS